ncbi:diguanylate cyclase domain-containing protein [Massilia sp. TS11]|uniref:diguanylate cyclase domain-containing protein n=1 Tax=Massilia sp. TS11 TaxID=2908003 RepID=UPI001EDAE1E6|nr:diguanylate cyclase [Massilia sp. TS11]MCG2583301.1 diguanylate cyclase [Massilia sp. TS11]
MEFLTSTAPARDATILIVDDAPANLALLRKMLAQQGYQTFVADHGERALSIARRVHPDLILLDVVMPGLDGITTCQRLKAHPATAQIPVIFMSAKNEADDVVAGFDSGAVDYIAKPLRMAEVCARVRTQLQIRQFAELQREQAERLRTIVNSMAEGLIIFDADGRVQATNPACDSFLGYAPGELRGQAISALFSPAVAADYQSFFKRYAADPGTAHQHGAREVTVNHRDGRALSIDFTLTPMFGREQLFLGLLHDISHHQRSKDALQRETRLDDLTGIANRRHFDTVLQHEWQRAVRSSCPLSLLVLDVDHFKLYNDGLGHAAGDACLRQVAQAIDQFAARPTDLAARYGGEEFVILFAETGHEDALALAEKVRAHVEGLRHPHPGSTCSPWVTLSIGVATMLPSALDEVASLFVAADRAMYSAKEGGRNRVEGVRSNSAAWEAVKSLVS